MRARTATTQGTPMTCRDWLREIVATGDAETDEWCGWCSGPIDRGDWCGRDDHDRHVCAGCMNRTGPMVAGMKLREGSLFSGYGGLGMGVGQVLDTELAWVSDIKPAACKVLAHRYPGVPNLGDITTIDWTAMKLGGNRKLNPSQVESAVRMYRDLEMSLQDIAAYFEVTRQGMWDLLRRRTPMRQQRRYGADNHFWRGGPRSDGRAHDITELAVERGVLVRPAVCENCGEDEPVSSDGRHLIHAHHVDYNRPLDVMWLCQPCHFRWHGHNTAIAVTGGDAMGSLADIDVLTGGSPRSRARTSPTPANGAA